MIKRLLLFFVFCLLTFSFSFSAFADHTDTYTSSGAAQAACLADNSNIHVIRGHAVHPSCYIRNSGTNRGFIEFIFLDDANNRYCTDGVFCGTGWYWEYNPDAAVCSAQTGQPANHDRWVKVSDTGDVVACGGKCAVTNRVTFHGSSMVSNVEVFSGGLCPDQYDSGNSEDIAPPTPPTTHINPDGSTTWCAEVPPVCVTGPAPTTSAPAPASSAPNHATTSHTTTDHPATSSSTTTTSSSTTTGSGDGSGSGGSAGTTTTDGTSHSTTDKPAHATSSATKCKSGVCDVGNADGQIGSLYSSSGTSVDALYRNFSGQVASSPIISSIHSFFDVSNVGGSCPTWHIPGNKYWGEAGFDFDFFCSPQMLALFSMMGFIVLAMGAFSAFRIAIY